MKKVLLTATVQSHIVQFHRPLAEILHENGYEVHVAAKDNLSEKNGLQLDFADKIYDVPFSRSPKSLDNLKAYGILKKIIQQEAYEVIHCNTPMGGIVTRLAAIGARKKGIKVFYCAHGFHFYKGASKKNWIIFYPIERIMARFCDSIITITEEDYKLAKRKFHINVEHIHGVGVYTDRYHTVDRKTQLAMRKDENLSEEDYIILCTGELNKNKNQKTLIEATKILCDVIPNFKILLAGNGPLKDNLKKRVVELGLENNIIFLGYRTDLEKITPMVDLVVSCSYREGLPLNILEAMLCKKPVVVSMNRGHKELVKSKENGFIVKADSVKQYVSRIRWFYDHPNASVKMGINGYDKAQFYTAASVKKELKSIYGLD